MVCPRRPAHASTLSGGSDAGQPPSTVDASMPRPSMQRSASVLRLIERDEPQHEIRPFGKQCPRSTGPRPQATRKTVPERGAPQGRDLGERCGTWSTSPLRDRVPDPIARHVPCRASNDTARISRLHQGSRSRPGQIRACAGRIRPRSTFPRESRCRTRLAQPATATETSMFSAWSPVQWAPPHSSRRSWARNGGVSAPGHVPRGPNLHPHRRQCPPIARAGGGCSPGAATAGRA